MSCRNTICRTLLAALIICTLIQSGVAQFFLSGKIVDATNGTGIAYANISVTNGGYGTASDEHGNFFIRIEAGGFAGSVKISCIGYMNRFLSVDSLRGLESHDPVIGLTPHIKYLKEVLVHERQPTAAEIVKEAIDAIPVNYIQTPFNMEFYSRVTIKDSVKTHFVLETILSTYRNGYRPDELNTPKIIQKRVTGTDPLHPYAYNKKYNHHFSYAPNFDIRMDLSGYRTRDARKWAVFSPSGLKKLYFIYHGVTVFDGATVYVIKYSEKDKDTKNSLEESDGAFHGFLYINQDDLAIVKHKHYLGDAIWEAIYRKSEGYYFPYVISSRRQAWGQKEFSVTNEVFLRNISTENVKTNENKIDDWIHEVVPYDESFWNAHYPIKKDF